MKQVHMSMHRLNDGKTTLFESIHEQDEGVLPTLSVSGVSRVDIEGLLTLSDGSSQGKVSLHHPLLVVAVDNRFRGHGQRVTLGHVLSQGG